MQTREHTQTKKPPGIREDDSEHLLNSRQVCARFGGVSLMSLWRWARDERLQFPQPVKLTNRNYWRMGDLRRWEAERLTKITAR